MTPIRIFIGSEPKTKIMADVLMHSIRSRTSSPVEFTIMDGPEWAVPAGLHQGTGFSLRRFMIPEKCGYKGRAIYQDADQIVMSDIAELWNMPETMPSETACLWCSYERDKYNRGRPGMQSSVMVLQCERAQDWKPNYIWRLLSTSTMSYPDVLHFRFLEKDRIQEIPVAWNSFNRYEEGKTKIIHFTVEQKQPWYQPDKHPATAIWEQELEKAIRAGVVNEDDFRYALKHFMKPPAGDHRRTFGMHPYFEKYLPVFAEAKCPTS